MFPNFIGVNDKFVNLDSVAMLEDKTDETGSIAVITTLDGIEIELTGEDADIVFEKVDLFARATDESISRVLLAGGAGEV